MHWHLLCRQFLSMSEKVRYFLSSFSFENRHGFRVTGNIVEKGLKELWLYSGKMKVIGERSVIFLYRKSLL
jgi:hypothetical protein